MKNTVGVISSLEGSRKTCNIRYCNKAFGSWRGVRRRVFPHLARALLMCDINSHISNMYALNNTIICETFSSTHRLTRQRILDEFNSSLISPTKWQNHSTKIIVNQGTFSGTLSLFLNRPVETKSDLPQACKQPTQNRSSKWERKRRKVKEKLETL